MRIQSGFNSGHWYAAILVLGGTIAGALAVLPLQAASPAPDANTIVRNASWNELHGSGPKHPFRYRLYKEDAKGSSLKEIVETKDGDVARLLKRNGKPLSPEEETAELDRLNTLMAHPEIQKHRHDKEQEDSARGDEMVRMLPDAFLYTNEGLIKGPSGPCYRLTFKPNPNFAPPDREGEVYHGMVGELWVDQSQYRLAKIDAHLIDDVSFGWGIIGRLFKGGSILVEDADVGLNHWETTLMELKLKGKILMVKDADFSTVERSSDFYPVPPEATYQDAIRMLTARPPAK